MGLSEHQAGALEIPSLAGLMGYVDFLGPAASALAWLTSEHGLRLVETHAEPSHDYLIYVGDSTGVRVTLDRLEDRVAIELAQVEDGHPIPLPLPGGQSQMWFGLNLLAELGGATPASTVDMGAVTRPNVASSEQAALAQAASSLRTFGSAVLAGDRSPFLGITELIGRKNLGHHSL
jgi:hypothetical protein